MNATEMTFGIEFEVIVPRGTIAVVGSYHRGVQIPELPQGWNAQSDCSIRGDGQCVEVVSPILTGEAGLEQVLFVLSWLKDKGAKVNSSTGLHIHVGVARGNEKNLAAIVTCVANYEKALYASTGTKDRERGTYAKPIQNNAYYLARFNADVVNTRIGDRMHVLNVTNVLGGGKPTIEFRCFAGSLKPVKVVAYVLMCLGLVERAQTMTRKTKWTAKRPVESSPLNRKGGEGQTAMCRLFYGLGWTKGQAKQVFGNVPCAAVSIAQGKKELMRLAKKYDACQ